MSFKLHENNVPETSQVMMVLVTVTHIKVTRVLQKHKGSFVVLNQRMRVSRACAPLVCSFRALVRRDYQICMIFIFYLVLLHWMPFHTLFSIGFVVVVIVEKPCSETNIFVSQLFIVLFFCSLWWCCPYITVDYRTCYLSFVEKSFFSHQLWT